MSWAPTTYRLLSRVIVYYTSYNQTQLHVIYTKSQKLNTVLNIHIPFFISCIASFVRMLHKMNKCVVLLQNTVQMYEHFLRQKEDSVEEGNVTEVEGE